MLARNVADEEGLLAGLRMLGHEYDLINFNCEHFANLVTTGQARCAPLEVADAAGALLVQGLNKVGVDITEEDLKEKRLECLQIAQELAQPETE
mmetsp:Transcript_58511/g.127239  ORF Transcript_58511/g.127239 Transcript_58511/m.127239 type:complete len:94 (+) Transcript_58511:188-469(+)